MSVNIHTLSSGHSIREALQSHCGSNSLSPQCNRWYHTLGYGLFTEWPPRSPCYLLKVTNKEGTYKVLISWNAKLGTKTERWACVNLAWRRDPTRRAQGCLGVFKFSLQCYKSLVQNVRPPLWVSHHLCPVIILGWDWRTLCFRSMVCLLVDGQVLLKFVSK